MSKDEKISLALSLIDQSRKDLQTLKPQDESLVTQLETNLNLLEGLITGNYESLVTREESQASA